jgi:predicted acyltransferase (DUF342 family)
MVADVTMDGKLRVTDDVSLNSKLYVATTTNLVGAVAMDSKLRVTDDVSLNSKLYVATTTNMVGAVAMDSKLRVTDDVSLNSKLYVGTTSNMAGDVTMDSKLRVTDDVSLNSKLYVATTTNMAGDVTMDSKLRVTDDVSLNSNLDISNNLSVYGSQILLENDSSVLLHLNTIQDSVTDDIHPTIKLSQGTGGDADAIFGIGNGWTEGSERKDLFISGTQRITFGSIDTAGNHVSDNVKIQANGTMEILSTGISTAASNGALAVSGGIGIAKQLNVGGVTKVWDTTESSGTDSGSLQVLGGVGIAKKLYVGGEITSSDKVLISDTTDATAAVNDNGALQVQGGAMIKKSLVIGETKELVISTGNCSALINLSQSSATTQDTDLTIRAANNYGSGTSDINLESDGNIKLDCSGNIVIANKQLQLANNKTLAEGGGISLYGGTIGISSENGNSMHIQSSKVDANNVIRISAIAGNGLADMKFEMNSQIATISGADTVIDNTTVSTSATTGALYVKGGVGIAKQLYVGGDVQMNSKLTVENDVSMNATVDISGNLTVDGGLIAGSYNNFSDYRIKDEVQQISNTDYNIDNLNPVFYHNKLTDTREFGVIAHEVQSTLPCLVTGTKDGEDYQSVNYMGFISLLIYEVQQLKATVKDLQEKQL